MKITHGVWFVCEDRQSEFLPRWDPRDRRLHLLDPEVHVRQRSDDTRGPDPDPSPSAWTCAMPSPTWT